jgi:hypothetical protein
MKTRLFLVTTLPLLLFGCSAILSKLYGIKTIQAFDQNKCEQFIKAINFKNIPYYNYYIDSTAFNSYYESSVKKKHKKDLSQPIQILYFENDSLISFHANCYASGSLTNLNWNVNERFNYFIPKSAIKTDSIGINLTKVKNCFNINNTTSENSISICIIWTRMFEKISKSAIETVIKNLTDNNSESKVVIYLINNDKSFIENKK